MDHRRRRLQQNGMASYAKIAAHNNDSMNAQVEHPPLPNLVGKEPGKRDADKIDTAIGGKFVEAPLPKVNAWLPKKRPEAEKTLREDMPVKEEGGKEVVETAEATDPSAWPSLNDKGATLAESYKENKSDNSQQQKSIKRKDKKEKWVPVEIDIPSTKHSSSKQASAVGSNVPPKKKSSENRNWREDAKDPSRSKMSTKSKPTYYQPSSSSRGASFNGARGRNARGSRKLLHHNSNNQNVGSGSSEIQQMNDESNWIFTFGGSGGGAARDQLNTPSFVTPVMGMSSYFFDGSVSSAQQPSAKLDEDDVTLVSLIKSQIEYYFSEANLSKDIFLRRKMDVGGFLPLSLIASFNRVQALTQDLNVMTSAVADSEIVELSDDGLKMRPKLRPDSWPLLTEEAAEKLKMKMVLEKKEKLNPNVPEFVPTGTRKSAPSLSGNDAKDDDVSWVEVNRRKPREERKSSCKSSSSATLSSVTTSSLTAGIAIANPKAQQHQSPAVEDKEELEFTFEEEELNMSAGGRLNRFSSVQDSDTDLDELSDGEISKLLIVTQTPASRPKKHDGYDRTGDFVSRAKMSQDLAQVINDGLYYYEEDLWRHDDDESWIDSQANVNVISQEDFAKLQCSTNNDEWERPRKFQLEDEDSDDEAEIVSEDSRKALEESKKKSGKSSDFEAK